MKYGRANKNEDFRKIKFILLEITCTFFTLYMLIVNLELGQNYNTHHPLNIIMVPYGDDSILSW